MWGVGDTCSRYSYHGKDCGCVTAKAYDLMAFETKCHDRGGCGYITMTSASLHFHSKGHGPWSTMANMDYGGCDYKGSNYFPFRSVPECEEWTENNVKWAVCCMLYAVCCMVCDNRQQFVVSLLEGIHSFHKSCKYLSFTKLFGGCPPDNQSPPAEGGNESGGKAGKGKKKSEESHSKPNKRGERMRHLKS